MHITNVITIIYDNNHAFQKTYVGLLKLVEQSIVNKSTTRLYTIPALNLKFIIL